MTRQKNDKHQIDESQYYKGAEMTRQDDRAEIDLVPSYRTSRHNAKTEG